MMINMKKVNYAAIDIGSNAVRLLIKCVNEENAPELMSKVQLIRIPLRLGRRFHSRYYFSRKRKETDPADESLQAVNENI
jgi:exopolyphosphatase/pppGpp-phosphohydrolase